MRNFKNHIRKPISIILLMMVAIGGYAQAAATATPAATESSSSGFIFDANAALALVAIILFAVIAVMAMTLRSSMELYKRSIDKTKNNAGKVAMIAGLLLLTSTVVMAQAAPDAAQTAVATVVDNKLLRYLLFFIIVLEVIAIFALIRWMKFFTGIEAMNAEKLGATKETAFGSWWSSFNKFKPIEKEESIDMGHSYDGIRELDNVLPPWFTWTFIATIVFGIGYLWRYHAAANPAPNQYQEYDNAVAEAKARQDAYLKSKGDLVNETNVKMLDAAGIEAGKKLFATNCVVCHGDKGQGGVGPNFTDDYWIHGGKIGDIFKTIKVGVVEKGMQSWKDVFSADQIAELSSYIKTLHGTNPPGAKEPQGTLFKEDAAATGTDSTAAAAKPDSAAKK